MPAELWDEAAALAPTLGLSHVARVLRVSYGGLRQRREASPSPASRFVEIDSAQFFGGVQGATVALSDARGTRLTIRLPAGSSLDITSLVGAFRRSDQ
jgi:hypothetical protein